MHLRHAELALEQKLLDEVQEVTRRLTELDCCHQPAYALSMRAYLENQSPADAIRQYERCEKNLRTNLDIEPGLEIIRLYHLARLGIT